MEQWRDLESIAQGVSLTSETDSLIWSYTSSGVYSSSSLYAIINFRGVKRIFTPAVWKIVVPPRIHIFLWLLLNNKIMTRDNLKKRNLNKPEDCVFCSGKETVGHLFFDCLVAKLIWKDISDFLGFDIGANLNSIAHYWIADSRHAALNMICSAVLWSIWTLRNDFVFNGLTWISMH